MQAGRLKYLVVLWISLGVIWTQLLHKRYEFVQDRENSYPGKERPKSFGDTMAIVTYLMVRCLWMELPEIELFKSDSSYF